MLENRACSAPTMQRSRSQMGRSACSVRTIRAVNPFPPRSSTTRPTTSSCLEGSEYELLPTLDLCALGVRLFAAQLHHNGTVRQAKRLIASLREQGYELVACRPVVKLAFLHRDLL
jgi:hypothetical protein